MPTASTSRAQPPAPRRQSPRCRSPRTSSGCGARATSPRVAHASVKMNLDEAASSALRVSSQIKLHKAGHKAIASTPSTEATSNAGSLTSLPSASTCSASLKTSLHLASAGASPAYVEQAERLLQGSVDSVQALSSSPEFTGALARQGVGITDLRDDSGLSLSKRIGLLAAVLQEKDLQSGDIAQRAAVPAEILLKQLHQRLEESVERFRANAEQHEKVLHSRFSIAELQVAHQDHKAQLEEERCERVQAAKDAWTEELQERARSRETRFRLALDRADSHAASRVMDREALIAEKEERTTRCLQQVQEAQDSQKRRLAQRFQLVQSKVHHSHLDAQAKSEERGARLAEKLRKSEAHVDNQEILLDEEKQRRVSRMREAEYQVMRISKMTEYYRSLRECALNEDRKLFEQCKHLMEENTNTLAFMAASRSVGPATEAGPA